jgi:hypothetical protein
MTGMTGKSTQQKTPDMSGVFCCAFETLLEVLNLREGNG